MSAISAQNGRFSGGALNRTVIAVLSAVVFVAACNRAPEPPVHAQPPNDHQHRANLMRIPSDSPKLKRIAVQAVQMRDLPMQEVTSPGQIDVNPNRLAHVGIPVPGRIASVAVRIGQAVRQGDPILTIESPDVDSAISTRLQAEANMTQAQAAARKAQADADRIRDLFEHEAAARKDLLNAEAQLVEAQSSLEQARVAATQARRRLEMFGVNAAEFGQRMTVRAPISGKVLEMNVVPGEFRTDTAASVATIADLASVWVTADVPETAIRLIQIGEALTVELAAYPGETFRARVTQIADTVDPQTRSVKVRAELANAHGRLRPEMFGRIRHVEGSTRQPVVPVAAVVEDGRQYVWKEIQPGIFERIAVQTGIRSRGLVAITAGLSEGDRVVVGGVMLLSAEGMK